MLRPAAASTRCPYAFARCSKEEPAVCEILPGHHVACHLREAQPAAVTEAVAVALWSNYNLRKDAFIFREFRPCADRRNKWLRPRRGSSAPPKIRRRGGGRCWSSDRRRPPRPLGRARRQR